MLQSRSRARRGLTWAIGLVVGLGGCVSVKQTPLSEYGRPLPPGRTALRLVTDPARLPDLEAMVRNADPELDRALARSDLWFTAPSSRTFFPFADVEGDPITHRRAHASIRALQTLLAEGRPASSLAEDVRYLFSVYQSVGYNGDGVVLFTGYYSPVFQASLTRTSRFRVPLYRRPKDLVTDANGVTIGQRLADGTVRNEYPSRREIEQGLLLGGQELVWLEDELLAYIVHVNGSAKLELHEAGGTRPYYIGYTGKNDRQYHGLGAMLIERGIMTKDEAGLPAIFDLYRRNPGLINDLILENDRYIFFGEYAGDVWPSGSLGVQVTATRTLATDKRIYPRGGIVAVDTQAVAVGGRKRPFRQLMLDQDTGGAIQAPGRADIFMGIGPEAEVLAGGQFAEGLLYYLILKPQFVDRYAPR